MSVSSPRALVISFVVALLLSVVLGSIYAWLGDKIWAYAVGTILFVVGVIVLVIGLLGAVEPKEGWATRKKREGRKSMGAQVTRDHPELEEATPIQLGAWGVLVGTPLIVLALVAFSVSAA
jgi:predicted PurR-regulated permease PerM